MSDTGSSALCGCPEISGRPLPAFYQFHSCEYVQRRRRAGAPTAAKAANEEISSGKFANDKERRGDAWNKFFSQNMERLARAL